MVRPVGVVLAGGAGRRMGGPKGGLVFHGTTLAERAVGVLAPICERVLLSVAPGDAIEVDGARSLPDSHPGGRGPLSGIAASFAVSGEVDLLVLACDYPFVPTSLLERLVSVGTRGGDVVLPVDSTGRDHPLVALWKSGSAAAVDRALGRSEYSVRGVLGAVGVSRLRAADLGADDIDALLSNWNTPADAIVAGEAS